MAGIMGIICVECGKSLTDKQGFVREKGTGLVCADCQAKHTTANNPGMCYLCATPIYKGDQIKCWTVGEIPVAAHVKCI